MPPVHSPIGGRRVPLIATALAALEDTMNRRLETPIISDTTQMLTRVPER